MSEGDLVKFPDWGLGIILNLTEKPFIWNECADVFFFTARQVVSVRRFKLEIVSSVR